MEAFVASTLLPVWETAGTASGASLTSFATALWAPSQRGAVEVCLQVQKYTSFSSVAVHANGLNSVPAWLPSQKGWFLDKPQVHQ